MNGGELKPSADLRSEPAAVVVSMVFDVALGKLRKPKHRERVISAIRDAIEHLEYSAKIASIADRNAAIHAQARLDAAEALRIFLANRLEKGPQWTR